MFENFFIGIQQDLKLAFLPPLACAIFRYIFILLDGPRKWSEWNTQKLCSCFAYGFWWGMDFNAYAFLLPVVLISLPGAFIDSYFMAGDILRTLTMCIYMTILYLAFIGKIIFFNHFHDIYNYNVWRGKHADKINLLDIFFNQDHGAWWLLSILPYVLLVLVICQFLLVLPVVEYIYLDNNILQYLFNTVVFSSAIALFYWFRYGGTFRHRNKPEWDEIPLIVKDDPFLCKATLDDLITLERVWKTPNKTFLDYDDKQAEESMRYILTSFKIGENPFDHMKHMASGSKIDKPKHIFLIYGESHCQALFDSIYDKLHIMDASKALRKEVHTAVINNFQPGGLVSRPSLTSILLGFYDFDLELNENKNFWNADYNKIKTSFPAQMKKLGYRTHFWYGGSFNHGSLMHFLPAIGFDEAYSGPEFCPKDSPKTWLGIHDHIFLNNVGKLIRKKAKDNLYEFHFIYTTSNHGPYTLPYEKYGVNIDEIMPNMPEEIRRDKAIARRFCSGAYADRAIVEFITEMRKLFTDSLFIITGDHAVPMIPFNKGILPRKETTLRERMLTSFAIMHPQLNKNIFSSNMLGEHMNILPTLVELIAPKGFEYYSIKSSLLENIDHVVTPYCWMTKETIGYYKDKISQQLAESADDIPTETGVEEYVEEYRALQSLTGWIIHHPEIIEK